MRPLGENVDKDTMKDLVETPALIGIVSNTEMRAIQKEVLCANPTTDGSDMFKELTEAQVSCLAYLYDCTCRGIVNDKLG